MEGEHRKILRVCMVVLLVLSLIVIGIVAAQEVDNSNGEAANETAEVPITVVYGGEGFALEAGGNNFHTLRIHIVRIRQIEPVVIREILEEDKSIEEIRGEIIEKGLGPFYQGHIRFADERYRLVNIRVTPEGANLTINADVTVPLQGKELSESVESVGTISVTVMGYESVRIGRGRLTIYEEEYWVVLDVLP